MKNDITIRESGMTFGKFSSESCFLIEKETHFLKGLNRVEFILLRRRKGTTQLLFLEAKSSIKRGSDCFDPIIPKFANSLPLLLVSCLGRFERITPNIPADFQKPFLNQVELALYLVIPDIPEEYLDPFSDMFKDELMKEINFLEYGFTNSQIVARVLNKEDAIEDNLIVTEN